MTANFSHFSISKISMHFSSKITCGTCLNFSHFSTALALLTTALISGILTMSLAYSENAWAAHTKQTSDGKLSCGKCHAKCTLAALSVHSAKTFRTNFIYLRLDHLGNTSTSMAVSLAVNRAKIDRNVVTDSREVDQWLSFCTGPNMRLPYACR